MSNPREEALLAELEALFAEFGDYNLVVVGRDSNGVILVASPEPAATVSRLLRDTAANMASHPVPRALRSVSYRNPFRSRP